MTGYHLVIRHTSSSAKRRLRPRTLEPVNAATPRNRIRRAIAASVVFALLLSACAADDEPAADAADQAAATADTDVLMTVGGDQIDINSLEGTDTILWFWAPW